MADKSQRGAIIQPDSPNFPEHALVTTDLDGVVEVEVRYSDSIS